MSPQKIRNFSIIAHIDHGKSTLADRFLELTSTLHKEEVKEQVLDRMELEREKGITIKLKPVTMVYQYQSQRYILNLIDTPGHTDFSYEVERSLRICEGALLLVDATQGIQAQTLANFYLAKNLGLSIIPLINKIDLPQADIQKTETELKELLSSSLGRKGEEVKVGESEEILKVSAKTGENVEEVLKRVVQGIPAPASLSFFTAKKRSFLATIFDSFYDSYFGVVALVRILEGRVKRGDELCILSQERVEIKAEEVGIFGPQMQERESLAKGEVGYIKTGLKEIGRCRVGSFLVERVLNKEDLALVKQEKRYVLPPAPSSLLYSQFYPRHKEDSQKLREVLEKLKLNDASLSFLPVHSPSLGFGFNCGFLGLLHLEIIKERIRREFDIELVLTQPMVEYNVYLKKGGRIVVHNAQELPERFQIKLIKEPVAQVKIFVPTKFLGPVMEVIQQKRGVYKNTEFLTEEQVVLTYTIPLAGVFSGLLNDLKSATQGYASLKYKLIGFQEADLVKLEIKIHQDFVPALAQIVPREKAQVVARNLARRLKKILPRQLFSVPIQVYSEGRVIAREDLKALAKDVTAKLYGGDRSRKDKLLKRQKKGKKRLASRLKVEVPSEVFFEMVK